MANNVTLKERWQAFWQKPGARKTGKVLGTTGRVLRETGLWIYKLRSIFLSIPVFIAAISFAVRNLHNLPEYVGLNLLASGEYAQTIARSVAVMGPLAITLGCLVLVFCSRRVLYPWLISVFSLALPWLIYYTNMYPS